MTNNKLQSITRYAAYLCLIIVLIGQFFKEDTLFLQPVIPYLVLAGITLLCISIYLKAKAEGFNQQNLNFKFIIIFVVVVVAVLILIYQLTKK